jgi:signal transduction histidine kinase
MRDVATALNAMAARLDALVQGSRAVVADVSHQLRTPLAAMRLRLELVADELTARRGEEHEDLAVALSELERLSRLVDGLLAVARAETAETRPAIIDVARLLSERQQAWQPVADERGSEIVVHSPAGLRVSATPGHLEQVLDNLLDNALNAVASSGHVTVSATAAADRICIRVEDDGPGMTQPQQQQAFHRFLSSRTDGGGTGLGLAIVHRLVTADGGDVRLTSGPDSGTAVTIDLPAARAGR